MKTKQVCDLVIRPVVDYMTDLSGVRLNTESAVALLLGTAAVESDMGKYIRQYPAGPARGIYQIEVGSFNDLWEWIALRPPLLSTVNAFVSKSPWPLALQVCGNLYLATAVSRLYYWRVPEALPVGKDPSAYGSYWKRFYNTAEGKGTVEKFVDAWERHGVGDVIS